MNIPDFITFPVKSDVESTSFDYASCCSSISNNTIDDWEGGWAVTDDSSEFDFLSSGRSSRWNNSDNDATNALPARQKRHNDIINSKHVTPCLLNDTQEPKRRTCSCIPRLPQRQESTITHNSKTPSIAKHPSRTLLSRLPPKVPQRNRSITDLAKCDRNSIVSFSSQPRSERISASAA